jgi:hypothetical protein
MKLIRENRNIRGKACPSATLSTTNPTWIDPRSNPGLRGENPGTNRLSHGKAEFSLVKSYQFLGAHQVGVVSIATRYGLEDPEI